MLTEPKSDDPRERAAHRELLQADLARTAVPLASARALPGTVFADSAIFALEQSAIFASDWLCVGRSAELPAAGDYVVRELGGDSIIVIRAADGALHACYNVCRHRGSRLLDGPAGSGLSRILCPYHSWSYGLDGRLQQAPRMGEAFCANDFALRALRLAVHAGFMFVNRSADGPALSQQLADLPDLTRFRLPELVCGRRIEYEVAANWKLLCENYSECYHCTHAHPQLARLSEQIARHDLRPQFGRCYNGGPMRLRDGIATLSMSGGSSVATIDGLSHEDSRLVHYYLIYPNLMLSPHPDYVLTHTVWPLSPSRSRVVCEWLFAAAAVAAADFDPADIVDFWDLTNRQDWALCERAQRGAATAGYRPGPYQETEDCVHAFDRWYAQRLATALS
jgi:Rieske 2Fe-2S family protein